MTPAQYLPIDCRFISSVRTTGNAFFLGSAFVRFSFTESIAASDDEMLFTDVGALTVCEFGLAGEPDDHD